MTISQHAERFAGLPVVDWDAGRGIQDPSGTLYRIATEWDAERTWLDEFNLFLDDPASEHAPGIVVGLWSQEPESAAPVVEALVAARDRLPHVRAIFFGDITYEECEISWLEQSDLSPLFGAYPLLERLGVRGGNGLSLGNPRHERLKELTVQSGGLPASVVREIVGAHLPALDHLELWLGVANYGGDVTVDDLAPILAGDLFPNLQYLGLRDSERADEIAAAVAQSPVLERLRVLDLSEGALTDKGAEALLASPAVARLERLDLHHHYCSDEMMERLEGLGIPVDVSEQKSPETYGDEVYYYVSVSE